MASFRAFLFLVALVFFFLIVLPCQALLTRLRSPLAIRIPLIFCRTLLHLLRVSVTISGVRETRGPVLLVANHVSWIDILVLGSITPFCFLAKREVASWPLLSGFVKVQGTVFVDRKRRRSIPPANRALAQQMREGRAVLLFPEGTTYESGMPGPFHTSHYAAARDLLAAASDIDRVTIQPAAVAYSSCLAAWIGDDELLPHLWRVLKAPSMHCHVVFAAPVLYARDSDRKVVARLSRNAIIEALALSSVLREQSLLESRLSHPL